MNEATHSESWFSELFQWVEALLLAVLIALLIRAYVFEPVRVLGRSMEETLYNNQRLLIYKFGYQINTPKRGDIVVLIASWSYNNQSGILKQIPILQKIIPFTNEVDYIKRVIAIPGDRLDIKGGNVYINGSLYEEPYVKGQTFKKTADLPKVIPEGNLFVMGDNRGGSRDSRDMGLIEIDRIKGKAFFRIWPLREAGILR